MASTRRLEIFRDPVEPRRASEMPQPAHDISRPPPTRPAPRVLMPSNQNITLKPPGPGPTIRSPLKSARQPSSSPPKDLFDETAAIEFPPPQTATFTTDSPAKRSISAMYQPIAPYHSLPIPPPPPPQIQKPTFSTFQSKKFADKENMNPTYHSENFAEFPDPKYGLKPPLKRTAQDAAPLQDRQSKKQRHLEPSLPEPQNFPIVDNGTKPSYSYAALIGMSILRSPERRLTLAQIYKWISENFSYYRASETGWQNSIRHNLSLNKAFIKQDRPKDDPGKGHYWAIEPGMEGQFMKDKLSRRPPSSSGPSMRASSQPSSESNLAPWPPSHGRLVQEEPKIFQAPEPSSDATIPASDAPSQDDEIDELIRMPPPLSRLPLSSPPKDIQSSPPVVSHASFFEATPPVGTDWPLPSRKSRSIKRRLTAMDDSGYFSSLDSSAPRHLKNSISLSEIDGERPQTRRGRAEEEIARIRSSSHDISPTKNKSFLDQPLPALFSSSPLRNFESTAMLPPLTPSKTFKLLPKPPGSPSPNTNLRNHRNKIRELVGSPIKGLGMLNDEIPFSPAFNILDDENYAFHDMTRSPFNIFADEPGLGPRSTFNSPEKRSVRRARVDRTGRSSRVLAEITGSGLNSKAATPASKMIFLDSPIRQTKSGKRPAEIDNAFIDIPKEDLFGLEFFDDEEPDDSGGLDLLQGFQKIGGAKPPTAASAKKGLRPALGSRSQTSRF